jgi:tetratricopeptide (TPR) repeat protein
MILADSEHRRQDALDQGKKAAERVDAAMRTGGASETERKAAARIYSNVALGHLNQHRAGDAVRYARRAVEQTRAIPSAKYELTGALSILSNALRSQGDLEAGLETIEEARTGAEAIKYPTGNQRALNLYAIYLREGLILGEDDGVNLGRTQDAISALQKAFDVIHEMAAKDPKDYSSRSREASAARELGNILRHTDPQRAIEVYDAGLQELGTIPSNVKVRRDRAVLMANSSYALRRVGRGSEARKRIEDALTILKETHDYPAEKIALGSEDYVVLRAHADDLAESGDPQHAMEIYQELLHKITLAKPDPRNDLRDAAQISEFYAALAGLYRQLHDSSNAQNVDAQRRELWEAWNRKLLDNPFVQRQIAVVPNK